MQDPPDARLIARGVAVKHAVEPAKEPFLAVLFALMQRFKQSGAEGRGEDHRHQYRQHHG